MTSNNSISAANLLKDIEKSYDPGKKLLKESEKADRKAAEQDNPSGSDGDFEATEQPLSENRKGQPMFQMKGEAEPRRAENRQIGDGEVMMREGEQREERREVSRKAWEETAFRRERLAREIEDVSKRLAEKPWGSEEWQRLYDERSRLITERKAVEQELEGIAPRQTAAERKKREEFAQRQWRRAHEKGAELVEKLNLGGSVTMVDSIDELEGHEMTAA